MSLKFPKFEQFTQPNPNLQYSATPFSPSPSDASEAVRDSIHLDWSPVLAGCPECGVRVKLWDGFAHRTIWNRSERKRETSIIIKTVLVQRQAS